MASPGDGTGMLPGFDFLQGLFKTAGAGLPAAGQWVAPTLDPAELDKRIQDLKTVQFWLEQNARVLAATIQALEVQRMTLNTLHNLNLPLSELTEALKIKLPATPPPAAEPPAPPASPARSLFSAPWATAAQAPAPAPAPAAAPEPSPAAPAGTPPPVEAAAAAARPAVDPMQWWGALTQQFTELAAKAVKDGSDALASAAPLAAAGGGAAAPAARAGSSAKAASGKAGAAAGKRTPAPAPAKQAASTPRKTSAGTITKASTEASATTNARAGAKATAKPRAPATGKLRRAG